MFEKSFCLFISQLNIDIEKALIRRPPVSIVFNNLELCVHYNAADYQSGLQTKPRMLAAYCLLVLVRDELITQQSNIPLKCVPQKFAHVWLGHENYITVP